MTDLDPIDQSDARRELLVAVAGWGLAYVVGFVSAILIFLIAGYSNWLAFWGFSLLGFLIYLWNAFQVFREVAPRIHPHLFDGVIAAIIVLSAILLIVGTLLFRFSNNYSEGQHAEWTVIALASGIAFLFLGGVMLWDPVHEASLMAKQARESAKAAAEEVERNRIEAEKRERESEEWREQSRADAAAREQEARREAEALRLRQLELAQVQQQEFERQEQAREQRRHEAVQRHLEEEQRRREEEIRKEEERKQRELAVAAGFERVGKLRQCQHCQLIYPHYLGPQCPRGNCMSPQIDIPADRDAFDRIFATVLSGGVPPLIPEPPPRNAIGSVAAIAEQVNQRLEIGDFLGIGNLILEVTQQWGGDKIPNELTLELTTQVRRIVAVRYGIPELLSYAQPQRDECLPPHLRDDWTADVYPHLLIVAYLLGATRINLLPPHDRLVPYYRMMALKQNDSIVAALNAYQASGKAESDRQRMAVERERWEAERTAKEEAERALRERQEKMRADLADLDAKAAKHNMDRQLYEEQVAAIRENHNLKE